MSSDDSLFFILWAFILLGLLLAAGLYFTSMRAQRRAPDPDAEKRKDPPGVFWSLLPRQAGLGFLWFLFFGCAGRGLMFFWLLANYLLFDLFLIVRAGIRPPRWAQFSLPAEISLRLSPWLMVPSALFLGLVGTGIYEEIFQ